MLEMSESPRADVLIAAVLASRHTLQRLMIRNATRMSALQLVTNTAEPLQPLLPQLSRLGLLGLTLDGGGVDIPMVRLLLTRLPKLTHFAVPAQIIDTVRSVHIALNPPPPTSIAIVTCS
jgi:hypothetical protein